MRPPEGAPNILIVLIDDAGFGSSSAFGGPCNTPTAERLAAGGLKYNRFHTTALCSPTRQNGPRGNAFTGRVRGVQIAIAEAAEAVDHLISPEQALHIAMARQ